MLIFNVNDGGVRHKL
ncbi:hypothetical protein A2U01_0079767, partial [Trifolium medium]|nr:hypothetical protein [Trifolium medium]